MQAILNVPMTTNVMQEVASRPLPAATNEIAGGGLSTKAGALHLLTGLPSLKKSNSCSESLYNGPTTGGANGTKEQLQRSLQTGRRDESQSQRQRQPDSARVGDQQQVQLQCFQLNGRIMHTLYYISHFDIILTQLV